MNTKKSSRKCEICQMNLKSEIYYKRHMQSKHPSNPQSFICDYDGKTFAIKNYLRIHMERHKEEILTCNVCMKAYNSKVTFRRHLVSHLEKFPCTQCSKSFAHKSLLNNHIASIHMNEFNFNCKYCTRVFANTGSRNNHHQLVHKNKDEINFKCDECKTHYESKEELRLHSFIHFNGDIKTCHVCDQIFKNTRHLNIHLQKHSDKKFQCEACLENFTFKSGLKKHIRLNRCKGRAADDSQIMSENKIQEIAKSQLKVISNKKRNEKKVKRKKIEIVDDKKDDEEEILPDNHDDESDDVEEKPIHKSGRSHLTYTCDKCGDQIKFRKNLEAHMKQKHTKRIYNCPHCSDSFKSRRQFKTHSLEIHGVKQRIAFEIFNCDVCDKKFDIQSIFETHKLSHENHRPHICNICSASFKSIGNLKRHQTIHVETRNYLCDICAKKYRTQAALKIHKNSVHADMKVYVNCPYCKTIVQEKNLKSHIFNQHGQGQEKPFVCSENFCGKRFKNEFLLKRHSEAVHLNVNRGVIYECCECNLTFNRQRDLRMHSFVHFNGVIHECGECGKKFKNKRLLLIHSAVHASDVKLACNYCDAIFQTAGGRRKHIANHHRNDGLNFVEIAL